MPSFSEVQVPYNYLGFYNDRAWLRLAFGHEEQIASALGSSAPVLTAARKTLGKMREVLKTYYTRTHPTLDAATAATNVANVFFTADRASAGQQGTSHGDTAARLQKLIDGTSGDSGPGELRRVMVALYNAAYSHQVVAAKELADVAAGKKPKRDKTIGDPDLSFKQILQNRYFPARKPPVGAPPLAALGLDVAALDNYARRLKASNEISLVPIAYAWRLAAITAVNPLRAVTKPHESQYGKDFYALGSMAHLADGDPAAYGPLEKEYGDSQLGWKEGGARERRTDGRLEITGQLSAQDLLRNGAPLSVAERTVLDEDRTTVEVDSIKLEYYPWSEVPLLPKGQELGRVKLHQMAHDHTKFDIAEIVDLRALGVKLGFTVTKDNLEVNTVPNPGESEFWAVMRPIKKTVLWSTMRGHDLVKWEPKDLALPEDQRRAIQGPEFPLQWQSGSAVFEINHNTDWYRNVTQQRHLPVLTGISGTAARMLATFIWLKVDGVEARHFLHALIAWMIGARDHSLYEVLQGTRTGLTAGPVADRGYFDALLDGISSTKAIPLYARFHDLLAEGAWSEPHAVGVPSADDFLASVYRKKAHGQGGTRKFQDLEPTEDEVRERRLHKKHEAAALVKAAEKKMNNAAAVQTAAERTYYEAQKENREVFNKSMDPSIPNSEKSKMVLDAMAKLEAAAIPLKDAKQMLRDATAAVTAARTASQLAKTESDNFDWGGAYDFAGWIRDDIHAYPNSHYPTVKAWIQIVDPRGAGLLKGLRTEHIAAIRHYCGPGYKLINPLLNADPTLQIEANSAVKKIMSTVRWAAGAEGGVEKKIRDALSRLAKDHVADKREHIPVVLHFGREFRTINDRLQAALQSAKAARSTIAAMPTPTTPAQIQLRADATKQLADAEAASAAVGLEYQKTIKEFPLSDLINELRIQIDMTYRGLMEIPPYHGVAWRGTYRFGREPDAQKENELLAHVSDMSWFKNFMKGKVHLLHSKTAATTMLSASREMHVAVGYAKRATGLDPAGNLRPFVLKLMMINGRGGRYVDGLSQNTDMDELIILPGTVFESVTEPEEKVYNPGPDAIPYVQIEFNERTDLTPEDLLTCSIYNMG